MDIKRYLRNLFYLDLKPNEDSENKTIQLVHVYHDMHYPYIGDKINYLGKYRLPYKMTYEEFFKVLSFYSDMIDNTLSSYPNSLDCVKYVAQLLPLLGAEPLNDDVADVFDVYFEVGYYKPYGNQIIKYYEWYSKNINYKDVKKIYTKYGVTMNDMFDEFLKNVKQEEKGTPLVRSRLCPPGK